MKINDHNENGRLRKSYFHYEIDFSSRLIKSGLMLLKAEGDIDDYYVPMFLLSHGYERLLKNILCTIYVENDYFEDMPKNLKEKFGHNLNKIREEILDLSQNNMYSNKFAGLDTEIECLNSKIIVDLLDVFSTFAFGGRYFYLDYVTKGSSKSKEPGREWDKIHMLISEYYGISYEQGGNPIIIKHEIDKKIPIFLERFTGILVKILNGRNMGQLANESTRYFHNYIS